MVGANCSTHSTDARGNRSGINVLGTDRGIGGVTGVKAILSRASNRKIYIHTNQFSALGTRAAAGLEPRAL